MARQALWLVFALVAGAPACGCEDGAARGGCGAGDAAARLHGAHVRLGARAHFATSMVKNGNVRASVEALLATRQDSPSGKRHVARIAEKMRVEPSALGPPELLDTLSAADIQARLLRSAEVVRCEERPAVEAACF